MTLLSVKGLTKNFGGLCAVSNVSMEIGEGELIGLIGPNGAGKTTFFNVLTGVYEPSEGTIELNVNGKMTDIAGMMIAYSAGIQPATPMSAAPLAVSTKATRTSSRVASATIRRRMPLGQLSSTTD
mgnify:CR=1 FL=1